MHYVTVEGLTKSFGTKPLFKDISFHIEEGDKIALVALNGTGKSTLLKIILGKEMPDEGKVWIHKDVTVVMLEQQTGFDPNKSIVENIFDQDHPVLNAIKNYELLTEEGAEPDLEQLTAAIARMDELNAWHFDSKVKQILGKLNIHNLEQLVGSLSGGQQKRVALAKVLIEIGFEHKHVLLIMDEPTNHLDVSMIEWLENFLDQEKVTLLLVTHDRYFLDSVCNEIMELDKEQLFIYKGDYENYLEKKAAREENEKASVDKARNLYRKELEWMRKQPKARTTKSKARQDAFYEVKDKASQKVQDQQLELNVKMTRLGGKILELKKVYKAYGDLTILKGFDYTFKKGERVGIVGKNGVGKSTFLNMLLGIEQPDSGKINVGETIVFGNYSQSGLEVKEDMRVIEFVKSIAENFPLADGTKVSAAQFLELFLFPAEKQYTFISKLSGGEKRRLHLLSILFRNPNFLVLDEPTNDLDLPTLSILESFLQEFQGCVIIVSHDRYFMDKLVDHLFVFEGEGVIRDFPGNYTQYREAEREEDKKKAAEPKKATVETPVATTTATEPKARKLSFKEKRELELLEKELEALEKEKADIETALSSGELPFDKMEPMTRRIGEIIQLLDEKGMRWLELSEIEG
ncbi:ATP-binding cassette, subfamily F, uup [Chitinophaga terrae (ex Kim and Jung 2007)]|uniref:ATP-binding cassette, subfamily F, uup n=1 Tax=Chitinophaga terrae (ex Kim and Jung 2007) TaxID=408074 RepID=A0A1H3XXT5_9BACT|nr:ABC-F family ATP-binding cassette domain-containing protein [Chitinophaga terrae (ex Kim and Jung 2007)]GEP89463.1 ABC transporter ATP-binding protein [Chitinophaga terrae (ex Kim and Jung 2007)]SEA04279.1 ATP-binding cassette, subfamily F, uup [Chitinophaga terrae (ex Kim and Jung 2007)]